MRRALVLFALCAASCRRSHPTAVIDLGGVHAEQAYAGRALLRGGGLELQRLLGEDGDAIASLRLDDGPNEGPIAQTITVDEKKATLDRAHLEPRDGVPTLVQTIVGAGDGAEVTTTIDPAAHAVVQRVHVPDASKHVRISLARGRFADLWTASGAPFARDVAIAPTATPWIVVGGATPLVVSARDGFTLRGDAGLFTVDLETHAGDAAWRIALCHDDVTAFALAAQLSGVATKGARVLLEPRDEHDVPLLARVLVEGPTVAPLDPGREVEPNAPLVDVVVPSFAITIPAGKWVFRATHGVGWSIAHRELEVKDGDVVHLPLVMTNEAPTPSFVGCDLHVHARGSWDARAVSYEDRVRSLVAVGVECAAATEHNHVGDHGPAAKELHVDDVFRALTGVELTTQEPIFGHFNVYPWPEGADIPSAQHTTPDALFDAVHALAKPGVPDFVFQLNHPRMRSGDGASIGYLQIAGLDPKTGIAKGPIAYRKDYDTLEVYNGYQSSDPDDVIAMIEEWTRMMDRGDVHVATGDSDSHDVTYPWAGFPRNLVDVGRDWRANGRPIEAIVAALKKGRSIVTSGPIVELRVGSATLGDTVNSSGSAIAHVEVRLTSWLEQPKLRLILGVDDLRDVVLMPTAPHTFVADVPLPAVSRKRALVALVVANVVGDGPWIAGMKRAIGLTNPIWLSPP